MGDREGEEGEVINWQSSFSNGKSPCICLIPYQAMFPFNPDSLPVDSVTGQHVEAWK